MMARTPERAALEQELSAEKSRIVELQDNLAKIKEKLLDKRPDHFSRKDVARAFFGSLVISLTFAPKGGDLVSTAVGMTWYHVAAIILATLTIISAEIYYIGYRRVPDQEKAVRRFGQFWAKRLSTYYAISILVAFFLVYIYNLNALPPAQGVGDVAKVIIAVSMPAGIGATIADLVKKFD